MSDFDLSFMVETEYPIACEECGYALTGLGEAGRCPECGEAFIRAELLWATYREEILCEDPGLDPEYDISHVAEEEFPISCGRCASSLSGLGDHGTCRECGRPFSRRQRLWSTYGPRAFVRGTDATEDELVGQGSRAFGYVVSLFWPIPMLVGVRFAYTRMLNPVATFCDWLLLKLIIWCGRSFYRRVTRSRRREVNGQADGQTE